MSQGELWAWELPLISDGGPQVGLFSRPERQMSIPFTLTGTDWAWLRGPLRGERTLIHWVGNKAQKPSGLLTSSKGKGRGS